MPGLAWFWWHTPNGELSKFTEKLKYIWHGGGADIIVYICTPTLGPIELLSQLTRCNNLTSKYQTWIVLFKTSKIRNTNMISANILSFFFINRLDFCDTHQMRNYPNVLKNWNIDGAVKTTKILYMDIIYNNLLF